jgi:hypothetical protein
LANELAAGTVAPVPVVAVEVALALGVADPLAVALATADPVGLADAVGVPPCQWCLPNAESATLAVPLGETATMTPIVAPNAAVIATGIAIRAPRLLRDLRRVAGRWPVSIQSTSVSAFSSSRAITLDQLDTA